MLKIGSGIKRLLRPAVRGTKWEHCPDCDALAKALDERRWKSAWTLQVARTKRWMRRHFTS